MSSAASSPTPADLEGFRRHLTGHCYRMLGSVFDADDAVQETLTRAWRNRDGFEGRAAMSSWLYRIATNVCLDFIAERKRRRRPTDEARVELTAELLEHPEGLPARPQEDWLEPIADDVVVPPPAGPHEQAVLKESIRLAFVAALQQMPGKQRAALLLVDVLGFSAAEAAECLELSVAALNSALQRARAGLPQPETAAAELSPAQQQLLDRYLQAFEAYDIEALKRLLHEDATQSMPPYSLWLRGPDDITRWMCGPGRGCRGSRLLPLRVCGLPGFAQYRPRPEGGHEAWALVVLELHGDRIRGISNFLDTQRLFPRFGLPLVL